MAVYVWLECLKEMHKYHTIEDFQDQLDKHDALVKSTIQNQRGFVVMIEYDTRYWRD